MKVKNMLMKKYIASVLFMMIFITVPLSADEINSKSDPVLENTVVKQLRQRHEYFSFNVSIGFMGVGAQLSAMTLRKKDFFWEILQIEGVFPVYMYRVLGGAGYTKIGVAKHIKKNIEMRPSLGLGGCYFLGLNMGCSDTGICRLYGFYLNPEISFVHNLNEKIGLQYGISFPIIIPNIFPFPIKFFFGFRY